MLGWYLFSRLFKDDKSGEDHSWRDFMLFGLVFGWFNHHHEDDYHDGYSDGYHDGHSNYGYGGHDDYDDYGCDDCDDFNDYGGGGDW